MKYIGIVIFVALAFIGCDPVKDLDWDRTAKAQRLRVGNRIKVDGIRWGLAIYTFNRSDLTDNLWLKKIGTRNLICQYTTLTIRPMKPIQWDLSIPTLR